MSQEVRKEIYQAFEKMKAKDFQGAGKILQEGLKTAEQQNDKTQMALFYSTLGVLAKMEGQPREAWRCYENAEKLLPDDPSLKIITCKLLIDQFAQYDTAIRKLKGVLKNIKGSGSFEHQVHATLALAHLRKGDRKKAVTYLELSMEDDFERMTSASNLNFEVIEAFLSRNFEVERCRKYVEKALDLARRRKEEKSIRFLTKLLESFERTSPSSSRS